MQTQQSNVMTDGIFHHQFILSPHECAERDGWYSHRCGGYCLTVHPSLPVATVLDKDGNEVGYALGWPIDRSGRLNQAQIRLPFSVSAQSVDSLEATIYSFGGRFAFVILAPDLKRLYLDAGGTLSAVFSEKRAMAGSTMSVLVMDDQDHPLWSEPPGSFPDDRPNQYWPAGLTPDPDISRLLPNHYLDLQNWRDVRHYPNSIFESISESDVPNYVERMVGLLRRHILGVVETAPRVYMPLTAGWDSRTLLACSRAVRDKVEYVTFDYRRLGRQRRSDLVDLEISQRLARRFGLRQLVISVSPNPPPGTELQYLRRIGFAGGAGKSRDFFWSCQEHLDLSGAWLTGFAGGAGKIPLYWRPSDKENDKTSPAGLLGRMNLPSTDPFQEAMRVWLRSLPELPLTTLLTFAYLEHRVGCFASPHFYGAAPFSVNLTPFCHREIFDPLLRLPSEYRLSQDLAHDISNNITSAAWPDLLDLPVNDYTETRRRVIGSKQKVDKRELEQTSSQLASARDTIRYLRERSSKLQERNSRLQERNNQLIAHYSRRRYRLADAIVSPVLRIPGVKNWVRRKVR